ncbi:MAG: hypothetical protein Q4F72_10345 [Desulfovibrionaceae bacterium]|nr:hypothetical protein [Desulfovibrionaceae bacterium]
MRGSPARWAHALYFGLSVLISAFCAMGSSVLSIMVDWTMLGMAIVCLMPGLAALDAAAMFVLAWSAAKLPERDRAAAVRRENRMVRLATLGVLCLASAGLSALLLAVPASSIWADGLTLPQLRCVMVALATLALLLSLELPYLIVNALCAVVRSAEGRQDD